MGNVVCCAGEGLVRPPSAPEPTSAAKGADEKPVEAPTTESEHDKKQADEGPDPMQGWKFGDGPPLPPCEEARRETVCALGLHDYQLEAPPDPEIENILRLVSSIFQVPNALVALFDEKRIFIREATGAFNRGDFPWRYSFCAWTLLSEGHSIMVIPDATKDSRFCENPMVTRNGGVRCYVGAPLVASNGHRVGTLCFADSKPREIDCSQTSILANFAEMVVRHIEKDIALQLKSKDNATLTHAYKHMKRALDALESCVMLLDTSKPGWPILYTNPAWDRLTGCPRSGTQGRTVSEVLEQTRNALPSAAHMEAVQGGAELLIDNVRVRTAWLTTLGEEHWGMETELHTSEGHTRTSLSLSRTSINSRKIGSARSSNTPIRSGSRSSRRLVLKLRPATAGMLDAEAVDLSVPPWVANKPPGDNTNNALYFATVESQEAVAAAYAHSLLSSAHSVGSKETSPMAGLQLGRLLGSGSYGSVYAGHWYGTPVAIKVVDLHVRSLEMAGVQMEALLGKELRHPHIVGTLTYCVHVSDGEEGAATAAASSGTGHTGASSALAAPASPNPRAPPPAAPSDGTSTVAPSSGVPTTAVGSVASSAYPVMDITSKAFTDDGSRWTLPGDSELLGVGLSKQTPVDAPSANNAEQEAARQRKTWIVLEFCDKGSLQDALDRGWFKDSPGQAGRPRVGAIVATAAEISSALMYLHSHGIVHGDLSAWNVLLTTSGHGAAQGARGFVAKVADFGLARALDVRTKVQTRTYGTITHQPPETLVDGIVSRETDTYSLGVLMWQMYTSNRPWAGLSHAQIIMMVASRAAKLTFPDDTPPEYAALAYQCLSYDAALRPPLSDVCSLLTMMRSKYT